MLDTEENGFDLAMVSRGEVICLWPQTDIFRYSCSLLILTYSGIYKKELLDDFQTVIFLTKLVPYSHKIPVIFALFEIFIPRIYKHHITFCTSHQRIIFQSLFTNCFQFLQILYNISEAEVSSNTYQRHKQKIMTEHLRRNTCTSMEKFLLILAGSGIALIT
jgi:hypothetical protein